MAAASKSKEGSRRGPSFLFALATIPIMLGIVLVPPMAWGVILSFDPINAFHHQQRMACKVNSCGNGVMWSASMIPAVFAIGDAQGDVARRLRNAGFIEDEPNEFHRGNAETELVCSYGFHVDIGVDDQGGLVSARGWGDGECL